MGESTFRFRRFTVHQDKCAMKVGTDAVLLGAWVNPARASLILDIGTGTGLIALMLAQRSAAAIHAVDIDENACLQARENFLLSPWFARLRVYHRPFQQFQEERKDKYDLIVSNPPYFHHAPKPPAESRSHARHHDQLTFEELIDGVKNLLTENGSFCLILPNKEGMEFMDLAMRKGLFCRSLLKVRTKADGQEKRMLMEFSRKFGEMKETCLTIREKDDRFSEAYVELTKDYYFSFDTELSKHRH